MSSFPAVFLKPTKDIPVRAGHPWIFSEAVDPLCSSTLALEPGSLVEVLDARKHSLGIGTWNSNTSIRIRMLSRNVESIDVDFFTGRLRALDDWKRPKLPPDTNGYRVVHAEADGLPGLIMDRYDQAIVFQLHTAGMDRLRQIIIQAIKDTFTPTIIVERSDLDVRRIEGLKDAPVAVHLDARKDPSRPLLIPFQEYGIAFTADIVHGQKTGFFLDQREARHTVHDLAKGKRVLNLFGYTGAFSIHAAKGGASFVATVDASQKALERAEAQFRQNDLHPEDETRHLFLAADVFELLRDEVLPDAPYDLIICDPPALAKNAGHLPQALRGYTDLNTACLRHL